MYLRMEQCQNLSDFVLNAESKYSLHILHLLCDLFIYFFLSVCFPSFFLFFSLVIFLIRQFFIASIFSKNRIPIFQFHFLVQCNEFYLFFFCSRTCRYAPLIACDYCPLFYHLDCLDPPLTYFPASRWMCPAHPEHFIVSHKQGPFSSLYKFQG